MEDGWYIKCFCENRKGCDTVIATFIENGKCTTFIENGKCSNIIHGTFCHNNQYTKDEYNQKLIEWLEKKRPKRCVRFPLEGGLSVNKIIIRW